MVCAAPLYGCIITGEDAWNMLGLPLILHIEGIVGVLTVF